VACSGPNSNGRTLLAVVAQTPTALTFRDFSREEQHEEPSSIVSVAEMVNRREQPDVE
jgi:hypothetical protein